MFLRNGWFVAAWADEIGQRPLGRRIRSGCHGLIFRGAPSSG